MFVILAQIQKTIEADHLEKGNVMETNYALAFNVHRIYTYTLKQCVSPLAQSTPGTAFYTLGIPFQSKGWEKQLPGKQTCQPGLCGQLRAINQVFCFLHSLLGSYHLS